MSYYPLSRTRNISPVGLIPYFFDSPNYCLKRETNTLSPMAPTGEFTFGEPVPTAPDSNTGEHPDIFAPASIQTLSEWKESGKTNPLPAQPVAAGERTSPTDTPKPAGLFDRAPRSLFEGSKAANSSHFLLSES